jgi:hypothetical protein
MSGKGLLAAARKAFHLVAGHPRTTLACVGLFAFWWSAIARLGRAEDAESLATGKALSEALGAATHVPSDTTGRGGAISSALLSHTP